MQNWHSFVVSTLSEPDGTRYVLDLANGDGQPLTPLVLNPQANTPAPQGPRPNQLWCADGTTLVNRLNGYCANVTANNTTPGTPVIAWPGTGTTNEQFTFTAEGAFVSALGGGDVALTVLDGSTAAGTPVVVDSYSGTPTAAQSWVLWPSYPVAGILGLPSGGFPEYSGDQYNAYESINQQLQQAQQLPAGMTVEQSYADLAISPAALSAYIGGGSVTCPVGVSSGDWQTVVKSLQDQLGYAADIQGIFVQLNDFINSLFINNSAILNQLGTDVGMGPKSSTKGTVLALVEGAVYTTLSALGPVASVAANLIGSAYDVYTTGSKDPTTPFDVAFADLWGELSQVFEGMLSAAGTTENAILGSWPMMQAVDSAIMDGELSWPSDLTAKLVSAAQPGYSLAIMQVLVPSRYGIQCWAQYADPRSPVYGPQGSEWDESMPGGDYNAYVLASGTSSGDCPSEQALQDIWGNGAQQQDVFWNQNGWDLSVTYQGCTANTLYTTIWNQTPDDLTVTANVWNATTLRGGGPPPTYGDTEPTRSLPAWSDLTYGCDAGGANTDIGFTITNPAISTTDPVASFHGHMDLCVFEAGDVSVTAQSTNNGYTFTNTQCDNGSFHSNQPGTITITVTTSTVQNGT